MKKSVIKMKDSEKIIIAVLIVGILSVIGSDNIQLTGQVANPEVFGCQIQSYYGECWELGEGWEEDLPDNPGWCKNCGYVSYEN